MSSAAFVGAFLWMAASRSAIGHALRTTFGAGSGLTLAAGVAMPTGVVLTGEVETIESILVADAGGSTTGAFSGSDFGVAVASAVGVAGAGAVDSFVCETGGAASLGAALAGVGAGVPVLCAS